MFIYFGTSKYGKTDHLPGMFYVETEFFHLYFVPIFPVQSYCVTDVLDSKYQLKIGISGKSTLIGFIRGIVGIVWSLLAVVFLVMLPSFIDQVNGRQQGDLSTAWIMGGVLAAGWIVFALTYLWSKPSPVRSIYLCKKLGISLDLLVDHYLNDPRVEQLMHQPQEDVADQLPDGSRLPQEITDGHQKG